MRTALKTYRGLTLIVALGALFSLPAVATVVVQMTIEEMTKDAPVIIHGRVESVGAQRDAQGKIWTYATIKTVAVLKGDPSSATVVVKQPGGIVGRIGQHVSGVATFARGEEVVVFLEPATDEQAVFVVSALAEGKISLTERHGAKVALRDMSGLSLASKERGVVRPIEPVEVLGSADAFLARVRATVKGAP